MSYETWSTTASANVTVNGVNIAEGCPPGNINNAIREVMAGVAQLNDDLPDVSGFLTASGAVFSGTQPKYDGRGAMLHHNASANASGRIYVQAEGAALPTLANGDMVFTY